MNQHFFAIAVGLQPLPEEGPELTRFIRWAQREHILGQVSAAHESEATGKLADILGNARIRSAHDRRMLTFEADRIAHALYDSAISPVLLKGSAYVAKGLRAGRGRRVSDIDILVREDQLAETEKLLKKAGWDAEASTAGDYDQQYYRKWMHELPPMRHKKRRTLVDVHHRLLPRTARVQPRHDLMMADALPLEDSALRTFSPCDRFIHSAIHIFADGAFETPPRSFIELYYLFEDLDDTARRALITRAADVGALKPVAGALWAVSHYFGSANAHLLMRTMAVRRVGVGLRFWLKILVAGGAMVPMAKLMLYVRSHYMRMPLPLLVRHLVAKMVRRDKPGQAKR